MKNTVIPRGFGAFLQERFGGNLTVPMPPGPYGLFSDSNARLTDVPTAVQNEHLIQAVFEYYQSTGGRVFPTQVGMCFMVEGDGFTLFVALSLLGSRASPREILLTVDER